MMRKLLWLLPLMPFAFINPLIAQTENSVSVNLAWDKLPYDRLLDPAGKIVVFGDSTKESHALDATLSPDGSWLAIEERFSISFLNTQTNQVTFTLPLDSIHGIRAMSTFSGITWYRKNGHDYVLFGASGEIFGSYLVELRWTGLQAFPSRIFRYKPVLPSRLALPNEMQVSRENGHNYLYLVLNGNNQVLKQNLDRGDTVWVQKTGVAPYGITLARNKIYVTNWGGRIPEKGDTNVAGVPWGLARIDPTTAGCREGSVSVYNAKTGQLIKEIVVGLHPNKIITSPDGNYVYLTCSNSDQVTVIRTESDEISENISLRLQGNDNPYFGDTPNGLAVTSNGKLLYVANGMDNALARVSLGKDASTRSRFPKSIVKGFIPTAAFPSSICIRNRKLYVTNLESFGATRPFRFVPDYHALYNAHHMLTSVSVIPVPGQKALKRYTQTVITANQLHRLQSLQLPPRPDMKPVPVPERIGEPSIFKHVLYIIKENRTYDQVMGDVKEGNGDSLLCIFGRQVTPNQHKLVHEFQLMDNFFVSGKCSAEGHSWTDASIVTDYIEKSVRAWFRSYPHVLADALVYAPTGFIWDNARNHHVSVRIYGEAATPVFNDTLTWNSIYTNFLAGKPFSFTNKTTLNTVRELLSPIYPAYDGHKIPDILRADSFIRELRHYESVAGDSLPQLMVMALPNDHTAATRPGFPTPRAMVADNDLALGRIIEALSHSRFWKNTVVFVVEDDSQDGWDHVSAYRSAAMVISAYSHISTTIHTAYAQPSVVRTIEQILGMPPMNIQDAIALPMTDCFTSEPDFTAYQSVPNQIPLDEMNPPLSSLTGKKLYYARLSLDKQFDGIDTGDDTLFNHILWYAMYAERPFPQKYSDNDGD